jgi:hypothetical protein
VTSGSSVHIEASGSLIANPPGRAAHKERAHGSAAALSFGTDLSLIALLARAGLLSPLVFRVWCYVRPFLQ